MEKKLEKTFDLWEVYYVVNNEGEIDEQRWLFTKYDDAVAYADRVIAIEKAGNTLLHDLLNEYENTRPSERDGRYYHKEDGTGIYISCDLDGSSVEIGVGERNVYKL